MVDDRDIARLAPRAPSAVVGVHRAFGLENDEQLVGAVRDQLGPPRHDECRAPAAHQHRLGRRIGAGGEAKARFLRRVRQRHRVEVRHAVAKRLPELRPGFAARIDIQPSQPGRRAAHQRDCVFVAHVILHRVRWQSLAPDAREVFGADLKRSENACRTAGSAMMRRRG